MGRGTDNATSSSQAYSVVCDGTQHPGVCGLDWVGIMSYFSFSFLSHAVNDFPNRTRKIFYKYWRSQ